MKPDLICPTCGSDDVMKNGMTRRAKQNHKCRECGRQFIENPQWTPKDTDTWQKLSYFCWSGFPSLVLPESWALLRVSARVSLGSTIRSPTTATAIVAVVALAAKLIVLPLAVTPVPGRCVARLPRQPLHSASQR